MEGENAPSFALAACAGCLNGNGGFGTVPNQPLCICSQAGGSNTNTSSNTGSPSTTPPDPSKVIDEQSYYYHNGEWVAGGTTSEFEVFTVSAVKLTRANQIDDIADGIVHMGPAAKEAGGKWSQYFVHEWGSGTGDNSASTGYQPGMKYSGSVDFGGSKLMLIGIVYYGFSSKIAQEGIDLDNAADAFQAKEDQKEQQNNQVNNNHKRKLYNDGTSAAGENGPAQYESDGSTNGTGLDTMYYSKPK